MNKILGEKNLEKISEETLEKYKELKEVYKSEYQVAKKIKQTVEKKGVLLHFLKLVNTRKEICAMFFDYRDYEKLAMLYEEIAQMQLEYTSEYFGDEPLKLAANLWVELFETTRMSRFRKKAENLGALDKLERDYDDINNYFDRPLTALAGDCSVMSGYDIFENDDGEFLIVVKPKRIPEGDYSKVRFVVNGGRHGILTKGPYSMVLCDNMHKEVCKKIPKVKEVLIAELDENSELIKEYMAPVVFCDEVEAAAKKIMGYFGMENN